MRNKTFIFTGLCIAMSLSLCDITQHVYFENMLMHDKTCVHVTTAQQYRPGNHREQPLNSTLPYLKSWKFHFGALLMVDLMIFFVFCCCCEKQYKHSVT